MEKEKRRAPTELKDSTKGLYSIEGGFIENLFQKPRKEAEFQRVTACSIG